MSHLCQWRRGSPGKCEHGNSSIYAPGVGVQGMSRALCLPARKETCDFAGADGSGDRIRNRRRRQSRGVDPAEIPGSSTTRSKADAPAAASAGSSTGPAEAARARAPN
jgi:hypothetical protein